MTRQVNQSAAAALHALRIAVTLCFLGLSACASEPSAPAIDPPGALVRLQRGADTTSYPGDLTIFGNGTLQLSIGDRGALRKSVPLTDLTGLQGALADPAVYTLAGVYPATLPAGAGDTLTIFGVRRRSIRFDPQTPDLPPALQRLVSEVMRLRGRF
jgi:hypothetical protein